MLIGSDVRRKESFWTVEDVDQDGQLSLFQVSPLIVDVSHHILEVCVCACVHVFHCV